MRAAAAASCTVFGLLAQMVSAQTAFTGEVIVQQTRDLVAAHRAAVTRLTPVAERTAQVLLKGGDLVLCCGENPWIKEGDSRAGGPIGVKAVRKADEVPANSVVWVSYDSATYEQVKAYIRLFPRNTTVVLFGPKPAAQEAETLWLDSFTAWDAAPTAALMGNVLSLWPLVGEVAAAASRSGKTLAFYQSAWSAGGNERNQQYAGLVFHKRTPRMPATEAGVMASGYLEAIDTMIAGIGETELTPLRLASLEIAERVRAGKPVRLVVTSHLMSGVAAGGSPAFRYESDAGKLGGRLTKEDYVVSLGYSAWDKDLFAAIHRAGAGAVWALATSAKPASGMTGKDLFVDEYWEPGDAAVTVQGYDVPILPPSGIAQLLLYCVLFGPAL